MSPTKPMRHILRSTSNTATADDTTSTSRRGTASAAPAAPQTARLPPSGRGAAHAALANKMAAAAASAGDDVTAPPQPIGEQNEFSGLISRAKEGLSASGRSFHKSDASSEHEQQQHAAAAARVAEKSEAQTQWEDVEKNMARPLKARQSHTPVYTHPFNGPLSGTSRVSRYQKGETNLDFAEARDSEWQWHQLGRMQVCTPLQTDNHTSTPPLSFLQAGCPSCRPTNSVKALKGK